VSAVPVTTVVAGVDSSTQATKVELRDLATGEVVGGASAPHPSVTPPVSEQHPDSWWRAFERAWADATAQLPVGAVVAGISVAGQQHGMVALDAEDRPVHPAKLWNDTETSPDADWLLTQLAGIHGSGDDGADGGGHGDDADPGAVWSAAVGSVPVAAFTVTKLSWLHRRHPDAWQRIRRVLLPHDYLTHRLTGDHTTDRGDASGTGYWSPARGEYRWDVLAIVDAERDWAQVVPRVLGPLDSAGSWEPPGGAPPLVVAAGTGDNMAAALGLGLAPGDVVISIGTSGTVYGVSDTPSSDPSGAVAGFADATGRFLPLVCTSNAAKVLDAVGRLLGVDHAEFDRLARSARDDVPVLLPYFDGERTPNRPSAAGVVAGLHSDVTREQFARAAVDGVACGLLDAFDALAEQASVTGRVVLTGGAAASSALSGVIAALVDRPVVRSTAPQAVATGAAVQAAAVVDGVDHATIQRRWDLGAAVAVEPWTVSDPAAVRRRYGALRDLPGISAPELT